MPLLSVARTTFASTRLAPATTAAARRMSTSTTDALAPRPRPAGPAPWRADFLKHVYQTDPLTPRFVLSTVHPTTDPDSPLTCHPRARTVGMRGLWASLPDNDKNPAPRNNSNNDDAEEDEAGLWESDMPCFTTDVRMDKASELMLPGFESEGGAGLLETLLPATAHGPDASGGGGQFEAVFWVPVTMTQWRLRGTAYVVGPDIGGQGPAATRVREMIGRRMRRCRRRWAPPGCDDVHDDDDNGASAPVSAGGKWSWERELTAHFGNMRPAMRGAMRNPPPGQPITKGTGGDGKDLGLGQEVEDLHDEVARRNFRVVVLVPDKVDRVDLSDDKRTRRWIYGYVGEDGREAEDIWKGDEGEDYLQWEGEVKDGWKITEVWP